MALLSGLIPEGTAHRGGEGCLTSIKAIETLAKVQLFIWLILICDKVTLKPTIAVSNTNSSRIGKAEAGSWRA